MSDEIRLELDEQQEDICFELDGPPVPGKTGNGIASIVMNPDYTLTINYTDGTSYTTPSIRGEEGNGISDITVNADYSLTIHMDDGSSYSTPPVRGPQGEDGVGIESIAKTGSSGLVDTYTITLTDGSTTSFTVTNGTDGQDGFSPTITVTNITGGHRLTITDKNGTRTVDVMDGAQGDPGFSPTVTVVDITGGHRVTITDSTGSHSFDVMDGTDAHITVDSALSDTSENPVQNKVITGALNSFNNYVTEEISGRARNTAIANEYDESSTYDVGERCMHDGYYYECITAITTPETWNNYHWGMINVDGELLNLIDDLNHKVSDVKINGTSIVDANKEADIPLADTTNHGVLKTNGDFGLLTNVLGEAYLNRADDAQIKAGNHAYRPIVPREQHKSVFYALAKAASDTTQSSSSNPVGTYTDDAKVKIQKMLGIYEAPWELIADATSSADAGYFLVNTDINGESFVLKKAMIYVEAPKTTTGTRDYISATWRAVNSEGVESTLMFPNIQWVGAASASLFCYELDCNGVAPQRTSALAASGYGSTAAYTQTANYVNSGSAIYLKWISLVQYNTNSSLIPSGTRVRIYGQRYVQ